MFLTLLACLLLTAACGYWVFTAPEEARAVSEREIRLQALLERKKAVYENLKDLHFERLAGKLSDSDFAQARGMLEGEAAAATRDLERAQQQ